MGSHHRHHVIFSVVLAALIIFQFDLISNNMSKLGDKMNAQHDASRILSTLTHSFARSESATESGINSPQHIIIVVECIRDNTSASTVDNNPIKNRAYNQCTSVCVFVCAVIYLFDYYIVYFHVSDRKYSFYTILDWNGAAFYTMLAPNTRARTHTSKQGGQCAAIYEKKNAFFSFVSCALNSKKTHIKKNDDDNVCPRR